MFMTGKSSNKKLCKVTSPFKDLYWTGSIIGKEIRTTLINFDGITIFSFSIQRDKNL